MSATGFRCGFPGRSIEVWKHTQLVIDVVPGRGGGFSLEAPEGMRFLSRGRVFTDDEKAELRAYRSSPARLMSAANARPCAARWWF